MKGIDPQLPIEQNYIAIGWSEMGDLSCMQDRKEIQKRYKEIYPSAKEGAVPVCSGVLWNFVREIKEGDVVLFPSKSDRMINFARVIGKYQHIPNELYPNHRKVKWLKHVLRDEFSERAKYEIGATLTLFKVKRNADEFFNVLQGGKEKKKQTLEEETIDIESTTEDFIINRLKTFESYQFEEFIAHLLGCMGYNSRVTPKSGDGGVDVIAHKDELGFVPPIIKVQCKTQVAQVGAPDVRQLQGVLAQGEQGLFITLGNFSKDAKTEERNKRDLRLVSGTELVGLICNNYKKFSPKYKTLIPLKRVYVPGNMDV